ncbi:dihydrofolate synthase / folylpolyglutamate synthase [Amphibacillus marinus]|uniref:tetrahydrofolate synthase n=1 Tax=Amphibacillus marinus TaxID=872970 RepID=A0A1H8TSE9_9BACI|nr:folylpolyglutamate synthase/dihydrofolate synthase family protein [Amphibacillus marinus]SEO93942.1 dihydrofolate synthase / folylpolyglutamate synthase [Amphibacillus marinus]
MFLTIQQAETFFNQREKLGIKPGLERMHALLTSVNQPEQQLKAIHIAGTNGKGSTATFISQILQEQGYYVGSFTSPSFTNRQAMIQLNNRPIRDQFFLAYLNKLKPCITHLEALDNPPSNFELIVAIAYQYFADQADFSIIEAGMGGLADATNCLTPLIAVITTVDLDHTDFLGNDIESIATHKAGIIKEDHPVVIGELPASAKDVVVKTAKCVNAQLFQYERDFSVRSSGTEINYLDHLTSFSFRLNMNGAHQHHNAALAIKTIQELVQLGYPVDSDAILKGLANANLPGRFQVLRQSPTIVVDGAHNLAGIKALVKTVAQTYPNHHKKLLFGAFKDKPLKEMIVELDQAFDQVIFTSFDHARAETADLLASYSNHPKKLVTYDWKYYLSHMVENDQSDVVTIVAGSLAFVGIVIHFFE